MASGAVITIANTIASLVAYPVYLHYLGAETYGLWLLLAIVLNFAGLGMLGIPDAVTKFVAEEVGRENVEGAKRCVTTSLAMLFASGIIIMIGIIVFRHPIVGILNIESNHAVLAIGYLPLIAILSLYIFIVEVLCAMLSGLGRMDMANYTRSVGRLLTPISAFVLLNFGCGLKSLLIANAFGYFVIHIISLLFIKKICKISFFRFNQLDVQWVKRILRFGGGLSFMSLLTMFISPFNKIMISRYIGLDAIPVYEIGYRVAMQLRSLFQMFFRALLPEISGESGKRTIEAYKRIRHLNNCCMRLILIGAIPCYIFLMLVATPLLKTWLGEGFTETMPGVLRVLLVSSFSTLFATPSYYVVLGMGKVRLCLFTSVIQAVVNVAIITVLVYIDVPLSTYRIALAMLMGTLLGSLHMFIQSLRSLRLFSKSLHSCVDDILVSN